MRNPTVTGRILEEVGFKVNFVLSCLYPLYQLFGLSILYQWFCVEWGLKRLSNKCPYLDFPVLFPMLLTPMTVQQRQWSHEVAPAQLHFQVFNHAHPQSMRSLQTESCKLVLILYSVKTLMTVYQGLSSGPSGCSYEKHADVTDLSSSGDPTSS